MMLKTNHAGALGLGRHARGAAGVLALVALAGCDSLLGVSNPGSVEATDLENPALAETLVNSALGAFECAYTSYVVSVGMLGQELRDSSNWANLNGWGQRGLQLETIIGSCPSARSASGLGAYAPLQQARYLGEDGTRLIESFPAGSVSNVSEKLGLLAGYAGYSTLLLGEGFCEMAFDQGPLQTREQVFQRAEERFTSAIAHAEAAGNTQLRLLAVAGRARTRLNLGNMTGAASDAEQIPQGFIWNAEYAAVDGSRENRIYNMNRANRFASAEPVAYADLMVGDIPDPRVPISNSGQVGHDNATAHWFQDKYTSAASPIPMASWEEAQLILAEARPSEAAAAINRLRISQGLPLLETGGSDVTLDMVLEERRRQLFLEGHRLNDMLRHDLPFPTGENHKGQAWGPITCMPLPDQERLNNPNIPG
jgi:starch-binding outer membrane protein, SusD/RagB family